MRDAEHHAIARIGAAYERCLQAAERLERLVDEASVNGASPPVDALRADFDAQIAVTRSVRAFTALCPPDGPDLDDVPGAAFVLAMYHAGDALEAEELDGLAGAFDTWLAEVSRWTPAHIAMPPTRPVSPAHSHVLATVDQWWGYHHERLHDDIVAMLTTAGQEGSTAIGVGAGGEVIKVSAFDLRGAATPQLHGRPIRRIMQWLRHIRR